VMMKRFGLQQSDAGLLAIAPPNEEEKVKNDENERITQLRE
jgi:hypothetical protein